MKIILSIYLIIIGAWTVVAQEFIYGDALPDAPELAMRGDYQIGVRTLELTNPDQIDVLNLSSDPEARYDRKLTVEIWYPASIPDGETPLTTYSSYVGRSDAGTLEPFEFKGRALRDAEPYRESEPYPLVIISHGYPGIRYMMSYLAENIASKGYVVVAIDHAESTYPEIRDFSSTLYFRSIDQTFVLGEMARLSQTDDMLSGLLDAENTALIGYSMGGYGALNSAGAGYNAVLGNFLPFMSSRMAGNPDYEASLDDRFKAIVVFAPWGGDLGVMGMRGVGVWDAEALANITIPSLWIAGSLDDISVYDAIVNLFDQSVNSERYLLTYINALHNVAPNPPDDFVKNNDVYGHLNEPMWDERRINNINQHFVTAFLNQYLKGQDYADYLNLVVENSNDGVVNENPDEDTYWKGFLPRTAIGMQWRSESPDKNGG